MSSCTGATNSSCAIPQRPTAARPEQKKELQKAKPEAEVAPLQKVRPAQVSLTVPKSALALPSPEYQEMVERNQELITSWAKKIRGALDLRGVDPKSVAFIYDVDVTGYEIQVCLACGRVGHDYMPTMVRKENPEIDMLSESLVVFLEVAARVGVSYGVLTHDEAVLPLREVAEKGAGTSHDTVLSRFKIFKKRHETKDVKDGTILDWMRQEMSKWDPSWANRKMAGEPADDLSMQTAVKMFTSAGTEERDYVMVKGQPPKGSLRGAEVRAGGQGMDIWGIAIGKRNAEIARGMFKNTQKASDMHELRELLLKSMLAHAESAKPAAG